MTNKEWLAYKRHMKNRKINTENLTWKECIMLWRLQDRLWLEAYPTARNDKLSTI